MAYVTVEDDTAAIEMLAFSSVINQYGGYIKENSAVVITGKLSVRDEKDPQILINRVRPISDYARQMPVEPLDDKPFIFDASTMYLQLTGESDPRYRKVRAIVNMFPGNQNVVVFFADTRQRRGAQAALDSRMVSELKNLLGEANVVLK